MKYTDIIWDFNGTIIDDVEAGILSVNKMLSDRGLPTIKDKDHYREFFRFPIIEYYRALGFDFDAEPYEVLAPIWVELYLENSKRSPLCLGVREAIDLFREHGLHQHVLSASELKMLTEQLNGFGILDSFRSVSGLDNIHAHSKTELALAWKEAHPDAKVLLIGDTEHDFTTAKIIGADCALIAGGHQPRRVLELCEGARIYSSVYELCEALFVK